MNLVKSSSQKREEVLSLRRITKPKLRELCKKDKLYLTPELNDVLYLHYQGFEYIENLEEYTDLKCLWLESNAISEIQGLDNQKKLKCLFLHNNLIRRIENLDSCTELDTINLSSNHIRKIENCGTDILPQLTSLNLSSNYLTDFESVKELENCKTLSVLDISNNRIDDILVVKVFAKMPALRVLVLNGNPVVSKLAQYRKTLILECKELTYLDSRPVFPRDRACAEAWKRGGYEEERNENQRWNRKERDRMRENVNATIRMRNKYLSADKQLELFRSSDSENEHADSQKEADKDKNGPMDLNDDIWDEVRDDKQKENASSSRSSTSSSSSSEKSCSQEEADKDNNGPMDLNDDIWDEVRDDKQKENASSSRSSTSSSSSSDESSSLSVNDYSDPNTYDSKTIKKEKIIEVVSDNICKDEIEEECIVEESMTTDELCGNDTDGQQMPAVEEIESDVDTSIFDLVDKMVEESGKSAAEYAAEAEDASNNVQHVEGTNEESIQEQIAHEQLSESLGQLTTNVSLAMQELEEVQQKLTAFIDNAPSSVSDDSEKSGNWPDHKLIEEIENDKKLSSEECQFEEIEEYEQMSSEDCQFEEISERESSEQKETVDEVNDKDDAHYNSVIKAFKKEEKELKALLQRLEDENERMFGDIDLSRYNSTDKFKEENEKDNENVADMCVNILKEILENLEIEKYAVKNYKFVDLDEYEPVEEPSQSTEENNEQNFKTLNSVMSNFNKMMEDMIKKNREEKLRQEEKLKGIRRKSVGSTAAQKTECLNNLLKSPNLAEFNADTNESLTKKLETVRVKQEKDLKRLVDRVYAQRDKYNDTLEVVDNRLVIVKQHTGEIEEIPRTSYSNQANLTSDSESDDGSNKDDFVWEGVPLIEAHRLKPNETFNRLTITEDMESFHDLSSDSDSEADEKFYSLPDNTNVIGNIDKDFINNLDFEQAKISDKAIEKQPIVQCARSYEELKNLISTEKNTATILTDDEHTLLDHLKEQENSCKQPLQTSAENVLLQKLIDRTKSRENIVIGGMDEKKYIDIQNDCNINTGALQEIEAKYGKMFTELNLTAKYVKYETFTMSENKTKENEKEGDKGDFNAASENENFFKNNRTIEFPNTEDAKNEETIFNETMKDLTTGKIEEPLLEIDKNPVNEDICNKETFVNLLTKDEKDIPNEIKEEAQDVTFEKIDDISQTTDEQEIGYFEKRGKDNATSEDEHTKDVTTEDKHIYNETNKNPESCIIEEINTEEPKENNLPAGLVYIEADDKGISTLDNKDDAENCGDNPQVINKYIKDDGKAYLVLQSAQLFEYIGDGIHNNNIKVTTSSDFTGNFTSAIDDDDDDDANDEKEATTMTEASVKDNITEKQNF